jgi:hypothetical protein
MSETPSPVRATAMQRSRSVEDPGRTSADVPAADVRRKPSGACGAWSATLDKIVMDETEAPSSSPFVNMVPLGAHPELPLCNRLAVGVKVRREHGDQHRRREIAPAHADRVVN